MVPISDHAATDPIPTGAPLPNTHRHHDRITAFRYCEAVRLNELRTKGKATVCLNRPMASMVSTHGPDERPCCIGAHSNRRPSSKHTPTSWWNNSTPLYSTCAIDDIQRPRQSNSLLEKKHVETVVNTCARRAPLLHRSTFHQHPPTHTRNHIHSD
mgnify:CR=1 FL=1